jgi:protein ImuB
MRRVVSLYLPTWPTDRLRRRLGDAAPPVETPILLVGAQGRKRMVLAADAAALKLRLYPGMAAAQARALSAEAVTLNADLDGDRAALERLALWALKLYAPIVAADPPDGLVMDITGAAHRFGGEEMLLTDIVERLGGVGVTARAAISGSWGSAHALARFVANPTVAVLEEESGRAIAHLPTRALRLDDALVAALSKVGIDVIGELETKPRAPLTLRFGPELTRRLDQTFGRAAEPIDPVEAAELIAVRRVFAEPIGAPETLSRYTFKLVEMLCGALEAKGLGAKSLDLRFYRVDNRIEVIRVGTAKPVRDIKRLTRLLCDKLETIDPGFGVETMVLAAPIAEALDWTPFANDLTAAAEPNVEDLVDTLINRLGRQRLYRYTPTQSEVPERSAQKVAPSSEKAGETWPPRWPRPTRLFANPEKIEAVALLPDQPPVAFTWRGIRHRVRCADGPERIFGEWWVRGGELDAVRDYFQIEDDAGERFWVFRRGDGEQPSTGNLTWYMHGLFG